MCGACGSGKGLPRWEDRLEPATRRVLSARAAVSNRLLGQGRLRVKAWGAGYLVADARGRSAPAADLDELWRTCGRWGFELNPRPQERDQLAGIEQVGADEEVDLDSGLVADLGLLAVWAAATAHTSPHSGPLRLLASDPVQDRLLELDVRPSAVHSAVRQAGPAAGASLSGPGARAAARLLLTAAALTQPAAGAL